MELPSELNLASTWEKLIRSACVSCVKFGPSIGSSQNEVAGTAGGLKEHAPEKMLPTPSLSKSPNELGYTGSRCRGPKFFLLSKMQLKIKSA